MGESSVEANTSVPESELIGLLIRGADELRNGLRINESSFSFMSRAHNLRGRGHYMYAVFDEIEQLAMALTLSQDSFDERPPDPPNDEVGQRLLRNTFAVVEREQALHIRRLTEILVDLINFSQTNSNVYYDHYLLYKELAEHQRRKLDFDRYFNCENLNTQSAIDLTKRGIAEAEKKLQLGDCWYLEGTNPRPQGNSKTASFKTCFDNALPLATKAERLVLGLYYGQAYREPSQSIHLNIGGLRSELSWDALVSRRGQIWLLAAHCLNRGRQLLNVRSRNSVVADISKAIRESTKSTNVQYAQPSIARGDFVSVFGSLAEVVASRKSKFGYKCFKVRYLSPSMHKEDWYPAIYVRKQIDGKKMRRGILARLSSHGVPARVDPKHVRQAMRKNVLELWEQLQAAANTNKRLVPKK
jgi:hypothetical protein